jgi:hypothetical protein
MIRQKREQRQAEEEAVRVYRGLRRALRPGSMSYKEYACWSEKLLVAKSEMNCKIPLVPLMFPLLMGFFSSRPPQDRSTPTHC